MSGHLVGALRRRGHDVTWATHARPGANDERMMALAYLERRIVASFDRGVGSRAVQGDSPAIGVVRLVADEVGDDLAAFAAMIAERLDRTTESELGRMLTILERERTRQRALPPMKDRG